MTISFGLVSVPVKYNPVIDTKGSRISGKFLDPATKAPVKQQYVNEAGEAVEKVTGYPYGDTFVVLGEAEAASLKTERDGILTLRAFVDEDAVDPLYFDKTNLVWPINGGQQGYDLICAVLGDTGKYLIGTIVLNGSTRVMALRYAQGVLFAHVCSYDENVRHNNLALVQAANASREAPAADYLAVAGQVFDTLADEFDFASVEDDYNVRLRAAIEATAGGKPLPKPAEAPKVAAEDLMAALVASVEAAKKPAEKKPAKRSKAKAS